MFAMAAPASPSCRASEVLSPVDSAEVAEAVRAARGRLRLVGGGTKGARAVGEPLSLAGLDRLVAYEPDELVLTVESGARLADIAALLAGSGQMLAFEPPDLRRLLGTQGAPTIGGALSAGLGGPRRVLAGGPRDHVTGIEAVGGRGAVFRSGGKVVKNVTGFDLHRLLAGAWGSLAAMTEISLRVVPVPETERTLAVPAATPAAALAAMTAALAAPASVSGAAWLPATLAPGDAGLVLLRLDGFAPSVAARGVALRAMLGGDWLDDAPWDAIRDAAFFAEAAGDVWRAALPPAAAPGFLAGLGGSLAFLDCGGAVTWVLAAEESPVHALARRHGGHALRLRGSAGAAMRDAAAPALAALTARVAAAFDPDGRFAGVV